MSTAPAEWWGPTHLPDGTPYGKLHHTQCKEQFSLAYAHAIASAARCKMQNIFVDDERVDFTIRQVADHNQFDAAVVDVQMKCTSQNVLQDDGVHWPLDIKHYDDLRSERVYNPKILVVLVVPDDLEDWLEHSSAQAVLRQCAYWVSLRGLPSVSVETKTVTVPNIFDVPGLLRMLKRVGDGGMP